MENAFRSQDNKIKKFRKDQTLKINSKIKNFCEFLKTTNVNHNGDNKTLFQSPWHLVVGPKSSGKTSILANSEISFVFKKSKLDKSTTSREPNWWATKNAVIIDSSGDEFNLIHNRTRHAWRSFLKLLRKNSYQKNLASISIVIDAIEIYKSDANKSSTLFTNILLNIKEAKKIFGDHIKINFILNKIDFVDGFNDFFADSAFEDRRQIWGISFSENESSQNFKAKFNSEFNALIAKLKNRSIHLLHKEKRLDKKFAINHFPINFSCFRNDLNQLIDYLLKNEIKIDGVFFSSASQILKPEIFSTAPSDQNLPAHANIIRNKGFFIHDLFDDFIIASSEENYGAINPVSNRLSWMKKVFYLLSAGMILFSLSYWGIYYKNKNSQLAKVNSVIAAYKALNNQKLGLDKDIKNNISSLLVLKKTVDDLQNGKLTSLKKQTTKVYRHAQQKILVPLIKEALETMLQTKSLPPQFQYDTLKAYLMLNTPAKLDNHYLETFLNNYWLSFYPDNIKVPFENELASLLAYGIQPIELNPTLVAQIRLQLAKLSDLELSQILLHNQYNFHQQLALNVGDNNDSSSVVSYTGQDNTITSLFTRNSFNNIYPKKLESAAHDAVVGNWVLGKINNSADDIANLTESLKSSYLNNYANSWDVFLNNVNVVHYTSISDLERALNILKMQNSPLLQILKIAKTNLPEKVLEKKQNLNQLVLAMNDSGFRKNIASAFDELQTFLDPIVSSKDSDKQTFELTALRMRNLGANDPIEKLISLSERYPDPLRSWLYNTAVNAWEIMLSKSQLYIDKNWVDTIVPSFNAQLANRFPFSLNANDQAKIDSFEYFFAQNGAFDKFFSDYLAPFIDSSSTPWQTKTFDGYGLQISDATLSQLQNINAITNTYFANGKHISIPFVVEPISMEKGISSVTLTLGNQSLVFDNQFLMAQKTYVWPDTTNANFAEVVLHSDDDNLTVFDEAGPWGFIKLLNEANLQLVKNPSVYQATFDKNGYSAILGIALKQQQNPFSLDLFKKFNLPQAI